MTLIVILIGMLLLLLTGVPVFAGLGAAAMAILYVAEGQIGSIGELVYGKLEIYMLAAIPLFAFMAHIMIHARVVDDLYTAMHTLVRHWPGGLSVATILSCTVFAAISGSSAATALTIGAIAIPQMTRFGYSPRVAYGAVAAGGTLGILIPPSGPMILFGVVADASIGGLFIGGILPGLAVAALFSAYCSIQAVWGGNYERQPRASLGEIATALRRAMWPMLLPPLILGGMYMGVFTATEGAAAGALAALFIAGVVYRRLTVETLYQAALEAARLTSMLFMILIAASLFSHVMTILRLPAQLVEQVTELGLGPIGFLLVVMAVVFVLGMFLETISIILVTTPIVLPVLDALEINLVWYGVLLMVNLEMALITPPVGMNLFVIRGIVDAPIREIMAGALPYVLLMTVGLVLVLLWPDLVLWLPGTMGFK
ncbi:MAG: TRAP transporter large permease subunit [Alphaproteobacteria bacterium]|nr:TRAP transporter large permease subunit [Alphaproteobacteria bacterium]MDP6270672.1 TRAP transporter large permease subunit [Alphaproteobacteria bacterium]MDP7427462.1 TRAP transporter large permease subunit [Alphaproteobacteria bacterium]